MLSVFSSARRSCSRRRWARQSLTRQKRYQRAYARTELKDEYGTTPEVIIITTGMERAKNMTEVIVGHYDAQRATNIRWQITTLSEITEKGIYDGAQWYTVQNKKAVGPKVLPRIWPEG